MDEEMRLKTMESDEIKEDNDKKYILKIRKLLSNYKKDSELWNFLRKNSDTLNNITDLAIYRRSVELGITPTALTTDKNQEAYALLKSGHIVAFNKKATEFGFLNLRRVDLSGAKLNGADLGQVDLSGAKLNGADLGQASLEWSKLNGADLIKTDLIGAKAIAADFGQADLSGANLNGADLGQASLLSADLKHANLRLAKLIEADLSRANLRLAKLIEADLSRANLSGADLSDSLIIRPIYENLTLDSNTTLLGAIIDDPSFIDYVRHFTTMVPDKIGNKKELKMRLDGKRGFEEIGDTQTYVADLLSYSILPE